ncbi:monocarboxylate transporter 13-like [Lineus longissimus]|uniref:monocarboxylate transporter 13-like n=1 Tax=Lineus longissimus TaxID=88925 RepID=UPI002B4E1C0C
MTEDVYRTVAEANCATRPDRLLMTSLPSSRHSRGSTTWCQMDHLDQWRWLVVGAVFVTSFLFGIERTMNSYYVELIDYFEADSSVMSLIGSVFYIFFCFTGVFVSPISDRYGPRIVTMLGGAFVSIGLLGSAFAPNVYLFIAMFGIFLGSGFAMSFLTMLTITVYYFKEKPLLAQGVGISGVGVGGIVMPILVKYLNSTFTWRGGLMITSGLALNICVCGALLRPIDSLQVGSPTQNFEVTLEKTHLRPDREHEKDEGFLIGFIQSFKALMCIRPFVLYSIQSLFVQGSCSILNVHAMAAVESLSGADDILVSYLMSFYSLALLLSIILISAFAHVSAVEPLLLVQIIFAMGGIGMAMVPVFPNFSAMTAFICLHGFGVSPTLNLVPIMLLKFVGQDNLRLSYGVLFVFCGVGGSAAPFLAGVLYDHTKNYANSMYLGGAGFALSVLLMVEPCLKTITRKRETWQPYFL